MLICKFRHLIKFDLFVVLAMFEHLMHFLKWMVVFFFFFSGCD